MAHGNATRNHLAKAEVHRVRVGKRYWLFRFSEQWGPALCDEWGEPVNNMPLADEEHPFWDKFEAWLAGVDAEASRNAAPQARTTGQTPGAQLPDFLPETPKEAKTS